MNKQSQKVWYETVVGQTSMEHEGLGSTAEVRVHKTCRYSYQLLRNVGVSCLFMPPKKIMKFY